MNALRRCFRWVQQNWSWLRWPVLVGFLGLLFYHHRQGFVDLSQRRVQWGYLGLALLLGGGSLVLTFVRWYLLVRAQQFPFRLRDALRLGFMGFMFNYVAPGATGGDLFKAVMIAREQTSRRMVAVATIFLDRLLGLMALFLVGAVACLYPTDLVENVAFGTVVVIFWTGGLIGLLGLLVVLHPAVPRWKWLNRLVQVRYVGRVVGEMLNAMLLYQARPRVLFAAVGISILGHLGILSTFYLGALALHPAGDMPGYWSHLQFIPAAELVGVIIPLPGGTGALEEAVAYFYGMAGASRDDGFLTGITFRVITIVLAAVGGCYYFSSKCEVSEVLEKEAPESAEWAVETADPPELKAHESP